MKPEPEVFILGFITGAIVTSLLIEAFILGFISGAIVAPLLIALIQEFI